MIIDKTNKVTKIVAIICTICAVFGLILTFKKFVLYRFVVVLSNAILAFVCFKGRGKDREICVGIFGLMAVYEIVRVFLEERLTISSGMLMFLEILGYVVIVAYLLGVIKNKIFPILGGTVITLLLLKNVYNLIVSYQNLQRTISSLDGNMPDLLGTTLIHVLGVLTYIVPSLAIIILIAAGAVKFTR